MGKEGLLWHKKKKAPQSRQLPRRLLRPRLKRRRRLPQKQLLQKSLHQLKKKLRRLGKNLH